MNKFKIYFSVTLTIYSENKFWIGLKLIQRINCGYMRILFSINPSNTLWLFKYIPGINFETGPKFLKQVIDFVIIFVRFWQLLAGAWLHLQRYDLQICSSYLYALNAITTVRVPSAIPIEFFTLINEGKECSFTNHMERVIIIINVYVLGYTFPFERPGCYVC